MRRLEKKEGRCDTFREAPRPSQGAGLLKGEAPLHDRWESCTFLTSVGRMLDLLPILLWEFEDQEGK